MIRRGFFKRSMALLVLIGGLAPAVPALAKDYILAVSRPNNLHLIDAQARKVERVFEIPGEGIPHMVAAPDSGKVAYVTTNHWGSVSGIDLDSGKEVFRADLDEDEVRVKSTFGMNVSRDGRELYVFQSPVRLKPDEYEVLDTRIAVYDTEAGIGAKPKRVFPVPRQILLLIPGMQRSRLYALGRELYAFNTETGAIEKTYPVRSWNRPNYGQPDLFMPWHLYEQADVFSIPYYVTRTDIAPDNPAAYKTGLLTFDLKTEEFKMEDFEDTSVAMFSSVVNPVRRNEVFLVFNTLTKLDLAQKKVLKRIDLDHSYYAVDISSDGKEIYIGGTMDDIAVYNADTLEKLGTIKLPGGGDQGSSGIHMVQR